MAVHGLVSLGEEVLAGLGPEEISPCGASLCRIDVLPGVGCPGMLVRV